MGALLCPAGMDWANTEYVHHCVGLYPLQCGLTMWFSVREKLRNGEIVISGNQWPVFLYHGYSFNKDDPWNGLFRSALLVTVRMLVVQEQLH
jgi:hypothetical protein